MVRCLRGHVYDVLLDLRPDSPTYLEHEAFDLTSDNREALYVPEGIAHGFQTLTDDAAGDLFPDERVLRSRIERRSPLE